MRTRTRGERERRPRSNGAAARAVVPHLSLLRAPSTAPPPPPMGRRITVATYNVHRWTGRSARARPDPARAAFVISELRADVIALQEVLRPPNGEDPLEALAEALGLHVVFAVSRAHRRGHMGNAILSRWPLAGVSIVDLSYTRMEKRAAVCAQFPFDGGTLAVIATHLALSDRTRHRQVRTLLEQSNRSAGPTVLLGDLNAWRMCRATRALEDELESHHNRRWPASFPSARPVLALDRVYALGARVVELASHATPAARRASDHLPIVATLELMPGPRAAKQPDGAAPPP